LVAGIDETTTAERVVDIHRVIAVALAIRATSTDELAYRFNLLRDTLAREGASDFAVRLLDAAAQDVSAILTARAG
jgi:hypothetical protein